MEHIFLTKTSIVYATVVFMTTSSVFYLFFKIAVQKLRCALYTDKYSEWFTLIAPTSLVGGGNGLLGRGLPPGAPPGTKLQSKNKHEVGNASICMYYNVCSASLKNKSHLALTKSASYL